MASRRPKFQNLAEEYSVPIRKRPQQQQIQNDDRLVNIGTPMQIQCDLLISDDENSEIYGPDSEESINALAEDIKSNGFKGAIMAYQIIDDDGCQRYMIESGHRRVKAAKIAGVSTIPVIITEKPATEAERRIRLISMNLHSRGQLKPTVTLKVIETLMDANKEEFERKDIPYNFESIIQVVGQQMELSPKSISKYRQFGKLIPELKALADEGISWSAIVQAASLPEDKQMYVFDKISQEYQRVGQENITRTWIVKLIGNIKKADNKDEEEDVQSPKIKVKRRNGSKILTRCINDITDVINGNAVFKEDKKQETLDNLQKIKELVDKKIAELSEE